MAEHTFIQVQLPAQNLVLGSATKTKGQAQALVESVVRKTQQPAFRVWSLVKGLEPKDLKGVASSIEERYSVSPRLKETELGHRIVYDVFPHHIKDDFWGTLLAFQTSFGPPWLLFKGGRVTVRAQGIDCEPPECAERLAKTLQLANAKVDVEIVQVPEDEMVEVRKLDEWRISEQEHQEPATRGARSTRARRKAAGR